MKTTGVCVTVFSLTVVIAADAGAQTGLQIPLQFDFLNPGARSLAMGSAFAGVADDATAAFTNPAGLTILRLPEASFEVRGRRINTFFLAGGRLSGSPSGRGIDTVAGPTYSEPASTLTDLSYLSFVYPHGRWALAGYRHQLIDVDFALEGQGAFQRLGNTGDAVLDTIRQAPIRASRELKIANYGISAAFQANSRVSIGVGVSLYDFSFDTLLTRYAFQASGPGQTSVFNAANFSEEVARQTQVGDDQGIGASLGVKLALHPKFTVGSVYRMAPKFGFSIVEGVPLTGQFQIPDVFTAGGQFRPQNALMIAFDYTFVRYGELKEDFVDLQTRFSGKQAQFGITDESEFHLGTEYVFESAPGTPALRGGVWFDPNHSATYERSTANDFLDELYSAYLASGKDLWHYTFGGGVSISRRLELNAGVDLSSRTRNVSGSAVVRF